MEKELKQIIKKLDEILLILGAQTNKIEELDKKRQKPVFNPIRSGKRVK